MLQQNFLSQIEFGFSIKRLPNVSFFVQTVSWGGMSMGVTNYPTPFRNLPLHGDKIEYDDLMLTVIMDEKMMVFTEIQNWMEGITKPKSFDQYDKILKGDGIYSDAALTILNSKKNPSIQVEFSDIFPISLSSLEMDITAETIEYIKVNIVFKHAGFKIIRL